MKELNEEEVKIIAANKDEIRPSIKDPRVREAKKQMLLAKPLLDFEHISRMPNILNTLIKSFPVSDELKERVAQMDMNMTIFQAEHAAEMDGTGFRPYDGGMDEIVAVSTNKEAVVNFMLDMEEILEDLAEVSKDLPVQKEIVRNLQFHLDFLQRDDYRELGRENSTYLLTFSSSLLNFPTAFFKNQKGEYVLDNDKYKEFIEKNGFLEGISASTDYMKNVYIPYKEAKAKKNMLTFKEEQNFREAYRDYLDKEIKFLDKIMPLKLEDVNENEIFKAQIMIDNWQSDRFGKRATSDIRSAKGFLDRGWPVEDITLLNGIKDMHKALEIRSRDGGRSKADREKDKALLEKMKKPYLKLIGTVVTSPDMRMELLSDMEDVIKEFNPDKNKFQFLDHLYSEAVTREVSYSELGSPEVPDRHNIASEGFKLGGLNSDSIAFNVGVMLDDIESVDPAWMVSSSEFRAFKKQLKELKDLIKGEKKSHDKKFGEGKSELSIEDLSKIVDKAAKVMKAADTYLNMKGEQFKADGNRKDNVDKQLREQPRVKTVIDVQDKLGFLNDYIESSVKGYLKKKYQEPMKVTLAEKNDLRVNHMDQLQTREMQIMGDKIAEDSMNMAYDRNIAACTDLMLKTDDSFYERRPGESIYDMSRRVAALSGVDYDAPDFTKNFSANNALLNKVKSEAGNANEPVSAKKLLEAYQDSSAVLEQQRINSMEDRVSVNKKSAVERSSEYRNNLISVSAKIKSNKLKKELRERRTPQKPEGKGMGM